MIRDITIGQYYPAESVIHRLDPRVKIAATFVYVISLFAFRGVAAYVIATLALGGMIALSKIPVSFVLRGLKSIVILLMITVALNLFMTPGTTAVSLWKLKITWEGIEVAIYMGIRLLYLIIGSSFMTFTTTPNQLTDALESIMKPLKAVKVPVHDIAMMMSIALRFIPILLEETDKIMKAQSARGADFESGGLIRRARGMVPLLIPLFVSAFRRANELAMAMESRCYRGGEGRTNMKPLQYQNRDMVTYGVLLLYVAGLWLVCRYW